MKMKMTLYCSVQTAGGSSVSTRSVRKEIRSEMSERLRHCAYITKCAYTYIVVSKYQVL